jgi:ATP-dependent DNA helicase RecQ
LKDIHQILKTYWGYSSYRPLQEEIIRTSIAGQDVLALLPTGGGKSICFQVPAMAREGLCIVITPLVALMRDQVEQLRRRNIKATYIHSGLSFREIDILLDNCVNDPELKFLYISPERLKSDLLLERVRKMKIGLLAIDEAHCIAQWGYDFRPSYLEIASFRELLPEVPVIALTATATPDVREDIQAKLLFKNGKVFSKSFARANLSYSTFKEDNKVRKLLEILKNVPGTSIVYVRSRKNTQTIADFLKKNNFSAAAYHAGMTTAERNNIQDLWIQNHIRVMVATNAFGMGIDKPDVRTVIHIDPPESLEAYYQEAGRAGRDEKKAFAVLLYNEQELEDLTSKVAQKYPSPELIRKTYQSLANYFKIAVGSSLLAAYDFDEEAFINTYQLPKGETFHALRRLEQEGFIQLSDGYYRPSKLHIQVDNLSLYNYQLTHPDMDRFIKAILRIYGGELFETYLEISEQKIAAQAEVHTEEVRKKLHFLQSIQLFAYEPAKTAPQIIFTTTRFDASKLPLNIPEINLRKEKEIGKVKELTHYATQSRRCRSLLLQEYFGEDAVEPCGVCDVCLRSKKTKSANVDNEAIKNFILSLLEKNAYTLENLVEQNNLTDNDTFIALIRQLLDEETLSTNASGQLFICAK